MKHKKYTVEFYIEWNDGSASSGKFKLPTAHCLLPTASCPLPTDYFRPLFDQLYKKIITGSINDPELYSPEMINEIDIKIY